MKFALILAALLALPNWVDAAEVPNAQLNFFSNTNTSSTPAFVILPR